MSNDELRSYVYNHTDMYLGTININAKIVLSLIGQIDTLRELKKLDDVQIAGYRYRLGEGLLKDQK